MPFLSLPLEALQYHKATYLTIAAFFFFFMLFLPPSKFLTDKGEFLHFSLLKCGSFLFPIKPPYQLSLSIYHLAPNISQRACLERNCAFIPQFRMMSTIFWWGRRIISAQKQFFLVLCAPPTGDGLLPRLSAIIHRMTWWLAQNHFIIYKYSEEAVRKRS